MDIPTYEGKKFLVITDAWSGFVIVRSMVLCTAKAVVTELDFVVVNDRTSCTDFH